MIEFMNAADQRLLKWLQSEINTGKITITVPASLLRDATSEGLAEVRRLAQLNGCKLVVRS